MIDSPQALIVEQVESGVVVRMAVLYELLAGAAAAPTGGACAGADDGAAAGMSAPRSDARRARARAAAGRRRC